MWRDPGLSLYPAAPRTRGGLWVPLSTPQATEDGVWTLPCGSPDDGVPCARRDVPTQHPEGGALPSAVHPQKPEALRGENKFNKTSRSHRKQRLLSADADAVVSTVVLTST